MKWLGTEHYIAINYLALPDKGGLSYGEIAKKAGVTRKSLYSWRQDPLFQTEVNRRMRRTTLHRLPEMMEAMVQSAVEGHNAEALKLLLQLNDLLPTPGLSIEEKLMANSDSQSLTNIGDAHARINDYKNKGIS
ncbi:phBC6A51 family helix-turn-helix protein [Virgibacillus profundi]|nr:phBC6A51 family helix-turn-helix protein [Virgibacillus profundi]